MGSFGFCFASGASWFPFPGGGFIEDEDEVEDDSGGVSVQSFKCLCRPSRSLICVICPASSIARYQASCPCVWAHACSCERHPNTGLYALCSMRAIWVATHNPIPLR